MSKFIIKRNDTAPVMEAQLLGENQEPVGIVGATVVFNMRNSTGGVVISRAAVVVVDDEVGIVKYSWVAADTARSGTYQAEFEVTFADGKVETFPKSESPTLNFITVIVSEDVA
jgi:hypothetical protein